MAKRVLMEVDAFGGTKISAQGYQGGTCIQATASFESLFSKTVQPRQAVGDCDGRKDDGERVRT